MKTIDLADAAATRRLGESLGRVARAGDVFLLEGDLGAGKTTLVQGLASALGCPDDAHSPTFSLVHELPGRVPLRHLDLYRLETADLDHLGAGEWFEPDAVVAVEWAERLGPYRPAEALVIRLAYRDGGRWAALEPVGASSERLLGELAC